MTPAMGRYVCEADGTDAVVFVELVEPPWCGCGRAMVFDRALDAEEKRELAADVRAARVLAEDNGTNGEVKMPRGTRTPEPSEVDGARALQLLQDGGKRSAVAETVGLSIHQVWRIQRDHGMLKTRKKEEE